MSQLIKAVDGVVVFKPPVNLEPLMKRSVSDLVVPAAKFGDITVGGWSLHVDDGLLGRLAAGATRAAGATVATPMEAWTGEVLCPSSLRQFKRSLSTNDVDGATVEGGGRRKDGKMFPMMPVTVDGN